MKFSVAHPLDTAWDIIYWATVYWDSLALPPLLSLPHNRIALKPTLHNQNRQLTTVSPDPIDAL